MATATIVLLFLSLILALGLSYYQYYYKNILVNKVHKILSIIRFLVIFGVLVLLINPKFATQTYLVEKPFLPIYFDNSASVKYLKSDELAKVVLNKVSDNQLLKDKFDIQKFAFDKQILSIDSINFQGNHTNIGNLAKNNAALFKNKSFPTIIITDGNQTIGSDYIYSFSENNKVYPVVVSDTTRFIDLRISQLNVNKYAFLYNKFPVEIFVDYNGKSKVASELVITKGNQIISKQPVFFDKTKNSQIIEVLISADKVGLAMYKAFLKPIDNEKNTFNNVKNFAVDVIDQKTEIAIISSINHPDLGALKNAISQNKQRNVSIIKPSDYNSNSDYNTVILYQPNYSFKSVYEMIEKKSVNTFTITGKSTDFNFLNQFQKFFSFRMSMQSEEYLANKNNDFTLFAFEDFGVNDMPPLVNQYGTIQDLTHSTNNLFTSKIRNIQTDSPFLNFVEDKGLRHGFLFGENIWKWRLYSHFNSNSFEQFDVFVDKIIQYLSSNQARKNLIVNHERFYNTGDLIEFTAQHFDKNYEFNQNAQLSITITNNSNKHTKVYDFVKGNNFYTVNLDGLPFGSYTFKVVEKHSKAIYQASFEILDFDIEKQFVSPDLERLTQLASQTQAEVYFENTIDQLIDKLIKDDQYQPIQKEIVKKVPLIDSWLLLLILSLLLGLEWFIRKYNGML